MATKFVAAAVGVAAAALWSPPASAQTAPPGGTAGTIEQEVRPGAPGGALAPTPEELSLTGRNDLVVLLPHALVELRADDGLRFTSNAFLSDARKVSDTVFGFTGAARVATQIAETYDVYAELDVYTNRYARYTVLDYDGFTGQFGGSIPLGDGFHLDLGYDGTVAYAAGFSNHLLTLHDLNVAVGRTIVLAPDLAFSPSLGLTRSYANPSDFDSWSIRAAAPLTKLASTTVSLYATPSFTYRNYDNFFPTSFTTSRVDWGLDASFGMSWTPLSYLAVLGQLELAYNSSSLSAYTYTAISLAPTLRLAARF